MFKPPVFPGLEQFAAATAGRNMTRAAYVAVVIGILMVVLLTVDPAYQAAHRWIDGILWGCLAFFGFEWVVRIRYAAASGRASAARQSETTTSARPSATNGSWSRSASLSPAADSTSPNRQLGAVGPNPTFRPGRPS